MQLEVIESCKAANLASTPLNFTLSKLAGKSESVLESLVANLRKSHSLSELRPNLTDYELSEEIEAFLNVLDKPNLSLKDLKLPADFTKSVSDQLHNSPQLLILLLEYIFLTAPFRGTQGQEMSQEVFAASIGDYLTQENEDCTNLRKISKILHSVLTQSLESSNPASTADPVEWVRNNLPQVKEFLSNSRIPSNLLVCLDNLYRQRYIVTDHQDASSALDELLTQYEAFLRDKFSKLGAVPYLLKKLESYNVRFGSSLGYQCAHLMQNVNMGVYDFNFEYFAQQTEMDVSFNIEGMEGSKFYRNVKFRIVNDFKIRNGLSFDEQYEPTQVNVCKLQDLLKWYSISQEKIDMSDYDFLAVYLDSKDHKFKYLTPQEELRTSEIPIMLNTLSVFNSKSKSAHVPTVLKVLFTTNPDPFCKNSQRQMCLYLDLNGTSTLGELVAFVVQQTIGYHTADAAVEIKDYALSMDLKKMDSKRVFQEKVASFEQIGADTSTPLNQILSKLRAAADITESGPSEQQEIHLVCFRKDFPCRQVSVDFLQQQPVVEVKLQMESIFKFLVDSTESKLVSLGKPSADNEFNGMTLGYYLPNILFVKVSKVSDWIQLTPELSLASFTKTAKEGYPAECNYQLIGGVVEVKIDATNTVFRPLVVKFDKLKGPTVEIYRTADTVYMPDEYLSFKIAVLCFEKKVEIVRD